MKKILIFTAILMLIMIQQKGDDIIIPESAIRFRVVANSNSIEDQNIKIKLSKEIENYIIDLTKNAQSENDAKEILLNNYTNITEKIDKYLSKNNVNTNYKLSIGRNYFPSKNYKSIKYDAGYYESIVLNIGHSQGVNWWCVIYPPLCLIDENENLDDVEYTTFAKEILKKYNI